MTVYKYVGRTKKGTIKRGTIEGRTKKEAMASLREKGISPRELTETKATVFNKSISLGRKKVKQQDFVIYCRQFATLIRAGIPIVEATNILSEQTENKLLKQALNNVEIDLKEGHSLSNATEKYPTIFPPLFVNMIRAGELTGSMDDTLDRLANHFENQYNLRKKIQSAFAYPIVLMIVITAVVIFLLLSIVPNFEMMFEQFDSEIPLITQIVISISKFLQNYWWFGLLIVIGAILTSILLFKHNKQFNYSVHYLMLKIPIFGKLIQKALIARMTRTLASLFVSAVPILQSLKVVEKVVDHPVINDVIKKAHDSLTQGSTLTEPLEKSWVFPPLVTKMTAIGEKTGSLDFMLEKIATFYEDDIERTVATLRSLIEPVMIILLAVVVGIIVLAIIIPMFSIFTEI